MVERHNVELFFKICFNSWSVTLIIDKTTTTSSNSTILALIHLQNIFYIWNWPRLGKRINTTLIIILPTITSRAKLFGTTSPTRFSWISQIIFQNNFNYLFTIIIDSQLCSCCRYLKRRAFLTSFIVACGDFLICNPTTNWKLWTTVTMRFI